MGGFGSGDWANVYQRKTSVQQCKEISVKILRRNGFFSAGRVGKVVWTDPAGKETGRVNIQTVAGGDGDITCLQLRIGGIVTGQEYFIKLTRTLCHFGGYRYWFVCPVVKDEVYCGNRCAKLYLPPAGQYFGCRECYDLTYESCQKSHKYDRIVNHIPEDLDLEGLNLTQVLRLASL